MQMRQRQGMAFLILNESRSWASATPAGGAFPGLLLVNQQLFNQARQNLYGDRRLVTGSFVVLISETILQRWCPRGSPLGSGVTNVE
jgi:hypothetical protein